MMKNISKKCFLVLLLIFASFVLLAGCKTKEQSDSPAAENGKDGKDGKDGNAWHADYGAPDEMDIRAKQGDFYLDIDSCDIYQLKDDGWWFIVNIKGKDGQNSIVPYPPSDSSGSNDGSGDGEEALQSWLSGYGEPDDDIGNDGGIYLDLITFEIWHKLDGEWKPVGNMKSDSSLQKWEEDDALNVVFIGDSLVVDTSAYIYEISKDLGVEKVKVGRVYSYEAAIENHIENINSRTSSYRYDVSFDSKNETFEQQDLVDVLKSEKWDYISIQQSVFKSADDESYSSAPELVSLIRKYAPNANLVWNMAWAYDGESVNPEFESFGNDQERMFKAITTCVKQNIFFQNDFNKISYTGTAIQNIRSTLIKDNVSSNGYNLSNYGKYVASVAFLYTAVGMDISELSYIPDDFDSEVFNPSGEATVKLSDVGVILTKNEAIDIAKAAVSDAVDAPFRSEFVKSDGTIDIVWSQGCYLSSNNEYYYTLINSSLSISSKAYYTTQKFTKETLPIGSVIVVSEGYVIRPDGWYNGQKNDVSPNEIAGPIVIVVDEKFWSSSEITVGGVNVVFNEWVFNIRKSDYSDISFMTEKELNEVFKIYLP